MVDKLREWIRNIPKAEDKKISCGILRGERIKYMECFHHQIGSTYRNFNAEAGGLMSVERKWTDTEVVVTEAARAVYKESERLPWNSCLTTHVKS